MFTFDLMKERIHKEKYRIRTFDIDQKQAATIPAIVQIMQEASMQHTFHLKASFWDMEPYNVTWVLLRKDIQLFNPVYLNDIVEVLTCPSHFDRFFAYRDYRCLNAEGECIASATSAWTLMNLNTRKINPMLPQFLELPRESINGDALCDFKLKNEEGMEIKRMYQVSIYDLDWNNHINNAVLIKFMLSAIPEAQVNRLKLRFISEAGLDDEIVILYKAKNQQILLEAFNKTRQQTVALALIYLSN